MHPVVVSAVVSVVATVVATVVASVVATVVAEKSAGKDSDGKIDLIWINGENFAWRHGKGEIQRQDRQHIIVRNIEPGIIKADITVQCQSILYKLFQRFHGGSTGYRSQGVGKILEKIINGERLFTM